MLRARLGLFLKLERCLHDLREAIKQRNSGGVVSAIYRYLTTATNEAIDFSELNWFEILTAFFNVRGMNVVLIELPILKTRIEERASISPWDHPDRPFLMWIHLLAQNYGWSLTEIESLWPEDAAMYVQEILVDEQLIREWQYSLSSVAYPADSKGKVRFKPLPRPSWMQKGRPRKMKVLKELLPVGVIINLSDEDEARH